MFLPKTLLLVFNIFLENIAWHFTEKAYFLRKKTEKHTHLSFVYFAYGMLKVEYLVVPS